MFRNRYITQVLCYCTLVVLTLASSCTDLESDLGGLSLQESFFDTQTDLDQAVAACYRPLLTHTSNTQVMVPTMGGDDITVKNVVQKDPFGVQDRFTYNPENIWLREWTWHPLWQAVFYANNVINNYEKIDESTAREQSAGQAYFLRAYAYFKLVRIFGDVPLLTTGEFLGTEERAPVADIYDQIYADLDFAENNLPSEWPDEPGRATRWAAKSLLAKVYLTNAGWPLKDQSKYADAATTAKEVLDGSPHMLMDNYEDLWKIANDNNTESVFAVQFCQTCDAWAFALWWARFSTAPEAEEGGWDDFYSEIAFFEEFPAGARKDATFHTDFINSDGTTTPWQNSVTGHPYYAKWRDGSARTVDNPGGEYAGTSQNLYLIRYADVALIYAEAKNMSGGADADAYEWVNKIRRRAAGLPLNTPDAGVDLSGLAVADFHTAVLDERKWEFAGEWQRWFDMTRNELVEAVAAKRATDNREVPINVSVTKDHYYAPIPQEDINLNSNLDQNPCCGG